MQEETNIIERLGGYKKVAELIGQNETTVANWRARGVPWKWRPRIAALAKQKRVAIPADFLSPEASAA